MGTGDGVFDKKRRSSRGTVRNGNRLAALQGNGKVGAADWGSADPKWIADVVKRVTAAGGAVTFGLSRDGGAHMLTVMLDGDRAVLWFNGDADLDGELEKVAEYMDTLAD